MFGIQCLLLLFGKKRNIPSVREIFQLNLCNTVREMIMGKIDRNCRKYTNGFEQTIGWLCWCDQNFKNPKIAFRKFAGFALMEIDADEEKVSSLKSRTIFHGEIFGYSREEMESYLTKPDLISQYTYDWELLENLNGTFCRYLTWTGPKHNIM